MFSENTSRDGLSVLLIEDNPGDRRLTEIALAEAASDAELSCRVQSSGTLAEGLAQLADSDSPVDAVLLDIGLPDAVGLDGLQAIRSGYPDLPVVVLTGHSDVDMATRALNVGASDYLEKGEVRPRPLLRAIRYAIERKRSERELVRLANTDPLTQLLNRRAFFDILERALADARRTDLTCALLIVDVDDFKEVNDMFGHQTGDELLIHIAQKVKGELRETDVVARLGGDEFAILATYLKSPDAAIQIAEKIVMTVGSISNLDGKAIETGASVGIAVLSVDEVDATAFARQADVALYKSKANGKGAVNFYDAEMDARIKASHELRRRIPVDIADGRFIPHFQPLVDANTHTVVSAEALARWLDKDGNFIPPAEFIPLAEEAGLISALADAIFENACINLRQWIDAGLKVVPISINISPLQFRDPFFGVYFVAKIDRFGLDRSLFNIEVTESLFINNFDVTRENLNYLRSSGIGIHLDDFGTGYSSLSLLVELPLDGVKLDRAFIRQLNGHDGSEAIIQATVELGRRLHFKVVAEGVETEDQAALLSGYGVDVLQGFLFSKPVGAEAFEAMLDSADAPIEGAVGQATMAARKVAGGGRMAF
ncbi:MAG: EAL domain-containing protein [Bauldia sp.]|nr:EAL domain-containing protein [Bauldia sp.]